MGQCMAGSTLQQLTRAMSPHCCTPAEHCILIHACTTLCPGCHAALASAPAMDGLHVAHRWLADMIVHLSLDVKPYSSVKQVGQPCTSKQHTCAGSAFRSCRLWLLLGDLAAVIISMTLYTEAPLCTLPAGECWQPCTPHRPGLYMSLFSTLLAAMQSPYPDLQQLAGSDDSDTFFRNAVAVMPHFARSVAAQLRQVSDRVGEPACSGTGHAAQQATESLMLLVPAARHVQSTGLQAVMSAAAQLAAACGCPVDALCSPADSGLHMCE